MNARIQCEWLKHAINDNNYGSQMIILLLSVCEWKGSSELSWIQVTSSTSLNMNSEVFLRDEEKRVLKKYACHTLIWSVLFFSIHALNTRRFVSVVRVLFTCGDRGHRHCRITFRVDFEVLPFWKSKEQQDTDTHTHNRKRINSQYFIKLLELKGIKSTKNNANNGYIIVHELERSRANELSS